MKNYERFSNEQIESLRGSKEGMDVILENCKYYVHNIAKKVYIVGYSTEDKMQIGYEGLVKAIKLFDLEKATEANSDFYTYAYKYIQSALYQESSKYKAEKRGYNKEEKTGMKVYSLEYTKETEGSDAAINYIEDETVDVYRQATEDKWSWMLKFLTQREYECLYYYYRNQETMEEIATRYGVSKQMVRKTLNKAIGKLKERFTASQLAEKLELR